MNPPVRHLLVILLSFAVVLGSGLSTYAVWFVLVGFHDLQRGILALLAWVATFYLGAFLFWKALVRLSPTVT